MTIYRAMAIQNTAKEPFSKSLYTSPVKPDAVRDATEAHLKSGRDVTALTQTDGGDAKVLGNVTLNSVIPFAIKLTKVVPDCISAFVKDSAHANHPLLPPPRGRQEDFPGTPYRVTR